MTTLFPPDYPENSSAPLRGFGEAFAEEIARSCIAAVFIEDPDKPRDGEVSAAAALTMFEGLHPRDHEECMLAVEMVGFHAAAMHSLSAAMRPGPSIAEMVKLRSSAAQMARAGSIVRKDLERKQSKPLLPRPAQAPLQAQAPSSRPSRPDDPAPMQDTAVPTPIAEPANERPDELMEADELPAELLAEMKVRPDGTPGSFRAYAPEPVEEDVVPTDLAIMWALATQPKPWRMVNQPGGGSPDAAEAGASSPQSAPSAATVPPCPPGNLVRGDTLAQFRTAPPRAEPPDLAAEAEESFVELELINTGGDPEMEAERQALIAAHPEGRPAKMIRYSNGHAREGLPGRT